MRRSSQRGVVPVAGPDGGAGADDVGVEVGLSLAGLTFAVSVGVGVELGVSSTIIWRGAGASALDTSVPATYAVEGATNAPAASNIHHFTRSSLPLADGMNMRLE